MRGLEHHFKNISRFSGNTFDKFQSLFVILKNFNILEIDEYFFNELKLSTIRPIEKC